MRGQTLARSQGREESEEEWNKDGQRGCELMQRTPDFLWLGQELPNV